MKKSSVKLNVIYQMLYEILALCLPLLTSPYISRILGAENLGIYSYTYSVAVYFGMICLLGVKNHGNRKIAKSRNSQEEINKNFINIYLLQFAISCISLFFYLIFIFLFQSGYRMYFLIQGIYVFSCLMDINWFFFGMEQFKLTVIRNTIIKFLTFISIFILVKQSSDLWKYCLIMTCGALLSQIVVWMYLPKYVKFVKPEWVEIKGNIKPMLILFIPVLATSLYNVMDKIMVAVLSTKTQAGFYENSEKITNCVKTVITSFGTVMMPRMSRLAEQKDYRQSEKYMMLSVEAIMCLAFSLAFGIGSVANIFAPIFWGDEFKECGNLLIGLSVALPFSAMANFVRTQYLIPNNMDNSYVVAVISGAIINLVINALLIPSLGAMGAVVGTVFAEGIVCIIQCWQVRKKIAMKSYIARTVVFFLFGIIMAVCVAVCQRFISEDIASLCIMIFVGVLVYAILCSTYFIKTKNELFLGVIKKLVTFRKI